MVLHLEGQAQGARPAEFGQRLMRDGSSVVEPPAFNRRVVGSIPTRPTFQESPAAP